MAYTGYVPLGVLRPGGLSDNTDKMYQQINGYPSSAPGYSGVAGGGGQYADLLKRYDDAYSKANAANESRYKDILGRYEAMRSGSDAQGKALSDSVNGGYQARYDKGMGYLQNAGQQEASDIRSNYAAQEANMRQRMADAGLANTTVGATLAQGNLRNQQADLARLNERLQNQYLSAHSSLSGDALGAQSQLGQANLNRSNALTQDQLGFMERRSDVLPDLGQYAALAQAMAAGGQGQQAYSGAWGAAGDPYRQGGGVNNGGGTTRFLQPQIAGVTRSITPAQQQAGDNDPERAKMLADDEAEAKRVAARNAGGGGLLAPSNKKWPGWGNWGG